MGLGNKKRTGADTLAHRFFAAYYERMSLGTSEKLYIEPLRKAIVGQAAGHVLEVGAGNGLNFAFYDPAHVAHLEAIEPDSAMLSYEGAI